MSNVLVVKIPAIAPQGVHDTRNKYGVETVSYGASWSVSLASGVTVKFSNSKLKNVFRIDERNLTKCKYLNLYKSSIV